MEIQNESSPNSIIVRCQATRERYLHAVRELRAMSREVTEELRLAQVELQAFADRRRLSTLVVGEWAY